jgi:hypothetical protein
VRIGHGGIPPHSDSHAIVLGEGEESSEQLNGSSVYSSFSLGATLRESYGPVLRPDGFPQHPFSSVPSCLRGSVFPNL